MKNLAKYIIAAALFGVCNLSADAKVLGIKGEDHAGIGIYIYDLTGDSVVVDDNASRTLTPASVMKSFTTASAMEILGKDHRFITTAALVGEKPRKGVAEADLVIYGGGDPTLESRHFEDKMGFCDSVVACLKRQGIHTIKGKVRVEQTMPDDGPLEEWLVEDVAWTYGAGIFSLNWRDNIFSLKTASGETTPHVPDIDVRKYKSRRTNQTRGYRSETLRLYGPRLNRRNNTVRTTMPNPYKSLEYELNKALTDNNISIQNESIAKSIHKTPVYSHESPELYRILKSLMLRSDNMYAEGILRAFAPDSSREVCIGIEKNLWEKRGLEPDYIAVIDGSGLARANSVSPLFIGKMLTWMARSPYAEDYIDMFPVSGVSGTMRNFMKDTQLAGHLAMKTGSMGAVQSYAGYLLDDNKKPTHVVVVLCNSYYVSRTTLKTAISKFLVSTLVGDTDGETPEEYDPDDDD